jgi:predicted nucleic acid-binding protein
VGVASGGPLVLDASVAAKCVLVEDHTDVAQHIARSRRLLTPDLLWAELGSALWARQRRRQILPQEARLMLRQLRALRITSYPLSPLLPAALDVAIALDHSLYDCVYVALAVAQGCPVVTADRRFHRAVSASMLGDRIVWIEDVS